METGKWREVDGGKWWDTDAGDMSMNEQSSASWDVLVCSPLIGFRVCILADAWVAEDSALGRGDPRNEQQCGEQHLGDAGHRRGNSEAPDLSSDDEG